MILRGLMAMVFFSFSAVALAEDGGVDYKQRGRLEGKVKARSSTNIDFNETLIEGKMKVPQGFFIQGRRTQSMANMVKLRADFRNKLKQSKFAVKAIVK